MKLPRLKHLMSPRRTLAMARKETMHILRDFRTLVMAFVMPLIMILLFGFGVSFDVDHIPVAIVDQAHDDASRSFVLALTSGVDFVDAGRVQKEEQILHLFRSDKASAAFVIPYDYGMRLARGEPVSMQILVDGSDGSSAQAVLGAGAGAVGAENAKVFSVIPKLSSSVNVLYNPALRSELFLVPGLVAYVMALAAVLLTALSVAREWERGNMEQLFATPVGCLEIVIGKLIPYLVIGHAQALLVLAVGVSVFHIPIQGSVVLLAASVFLFLVCMLGQGLLISVVARNQQMATMFGAVSTILPVMMLSGFLFPINNMPWLLQWLSLIFPARYFMEILRGILLKGTGLGVLWPNFLGLAIFAVVVLALSRFKFRRRIA